MTTKNKSEEKGKVKVGKLDLNKETVKNLTNSESKKVKGGLGGQAAGCPTIGRGSKSSGCCYTG